MTRPSALGKVTNPVTYSYPKWLCGRVPHIRHTQGHASPLCYFLSSSCSEPLKLPHSHWSGEYLQEDGVLIMRVIYRSQIRPGLTPRSIFTVLRYVTRSFASIIWSTVSDSILLKYAYERNFSSKCPLATLGLLLSHPPFGDNLKRHRVEDLLTE